jgi:hypothetical protein
MDCEEFEVLVTNDSMRIRKFSRVHPRLIVMGLSYLAGATAIIFVLAKRRFSSANSAKSLSEAVSEAVQRAAAANYVQCAAVRPLCCRFLSRPTLYSCNRWLQ